jgi:Mg2+ and Co2+ transporter CorA
MLAQQRCVFREGLEVPPCQVAAAGGIARRFPACPARSSGAAINRHLVESVPDEMRRLTESSFAQSEQVKRILSWAAILFAPTLIGTIYRMNFHTMPELDWIFGYPMAIGLMIGMGLILYAAFKRNNWI